MRKLEGRPERRRKRRKRQGRSGREGATWMGARDGCGELAEQGRGGRRRKPACGLGGAGAGARVIKRLIVVDQVAVRHRSHGLVGAGHGAE